jgi:hypothetical protein
MCGHQSRHTVALVGGYVRSGRILLYDDEAGELLNAAAA